MPKEQKVKRTATQYKNQYSAEKYDRLSVFVPKGRSSDLKDHASALGESLNSMAGRLFRAELRYTDDEWKNGKE